MTTYLASVKWEGNIKVMELEANSMKELKKELRSNGYQVRFICLPENFDQACGDYYWKLNKKRHINKAIREARKS